MVRKICKANSVLGRVIEAVNVVVYTEVQENNAVVVEMEN